jgi:hypothetical protein
MILPPRLFTEHPSASAEDHTIVKERGLGLIGPPLDEPEADQAGEIPRRCGRGDMVLDRPVFSGNLNLCERQGGDPRRRWDGR